jgi:hypothetical protein
LRFFSLSSPRSHQLSRPLPSHSSLQEVHLEPSASQEMKEKKPKDPLSELWYSTNTVPLQYAAYGVPTLEPPKTRKLMADPLIQLYYQNFHHAHPILLPLKALTGPLGQHIPPYVFTVMRYIGAHYHRDLSVQKSFKEAAWEVLSETGEPRNSFQVQSMLLLAITAHAHGESERSHRVMESAVGLALDLGMHRASFAIENSMQSPVVEEMWRRTYWELYVVDALIGSLREQNTFSLYHVQSDLTLPCDEAVYCKAEVCHQLDRRLFPLLTFILDSSFPGDTRLKSSSRTGRWA